MRDMHAFHAFWIQKFGEKKVPKAREGMFAWLEREEREQREERQRQEGRPIKNNNSNLNNWRK